MTKHLKNQVHGSAGMAVCTTLAVVVSFMIPLVATATEPLAPVTSWELADAGDAQLDLLAVNGGYETTVSVDSIVLAVANTPITLIDNPPLDSEPFRTTSDVVPVFKHPGFRLGSEFMPPEVQTFEFAFFAGLSTMFAFAIAIAMRDPLYQGINRGMERLAIRVHGERTTHRRRRRPSSSSKYASLSYYLNGSEAGRRRRRSRSKSSSRREQSPHRTSDAWYHETAPQVRDRIIEAVVQTNSQTVATGLLTCGN